MGIWDEVDECNALRAKLGQQPWFYMGDMEPLRGALATCVDLTFGYANVVTLTALASATGADGAYLLERGTVILDRWRLDARRRLRSAMKPFGLTMAELVADYPNRADRYKRLGRLAEALWVYGFNDRERDRVLVLDRQAYTDSGEDFGETEDCNDPAGQFMEALYS